jgi:hypothetical protein
MSKWAIFILIFVVISCSNSNKPGLKFSEKGREVPEFSADSAYHFVQQQVDFGPRVPNTQAHRNAQTFFEKKLRDYAGKNSVFTQTFTADGYNEKLELGNIIAAFNTSSPDRIMLSAHWDSRPRADQDSVRRDEPILGADDGGSGVAILLELARMFQQNPPPIGVDIVLFDGEDYGKSSDLAKYFIGSRYWTENPPVPGYKPRFGILLDMVGAKNAQFYKEQYSMVYAPNLVNEIWDIAQEMEHEDIFINQKGGAVSDDHVIINEQANIPFIDIINHTRSPGGGAEFAPHWHTHADRMNIISKNTLQAVGDVLAELIYNRL